MTKPVLTDMDKHDIAQLYSMGDADQDELAILYNCSRRTVRRALIELGVIESQERKQVSLTKDELAVHEEAKRFGLKPGSLTKLMSQPALTRKNVELYLSRMPTTELTQTMSTVSSVRKMAHDRMLREQQGKVAANG